jgi:hypothetical protein
MIDFLVNTVFNHVMDQITADNKLISDLGGPSKVAERLGFPKAGGQQRVQNWLSRGIPSHIKVANPELFMPNLSGTRPELAQASTPIPVDIPATDPELSHAMAEAAKAGLIERRCLVRRADDRARLAAAGQGV